MSEKRNMPKPQLRQLGKTAILLLLGFTVGVVVSVTSERSVTPSTLRAAISQLSPAPKEVDFGQLVDVWDRIHRDYVNANIDDRKLLQGALAGMVAGLGDPYSTFMTSESAKKFEDELSGTFEGIGMQVGYKDKKMTVIAPLPDSPAEKSGIKAGDQLLTVDNIDVSTLNLDQVVDKIRGPRGSSVTMRISRGKEQQLETFTIIRQTIIVESVTGKKVEHNGKHLVEVIVSSFNRDTGRELRTKLKALNAQSSDGILLDLRNNPGGYLDQAIDITGIFLSQGEVVSEVDRDGQKKSLSVAHNALLPATKVVILVDGGSASASEIVAGAIQDSGRGKIIGTQTFGKGSVQDYQTLNDGSSLKLTIAKWFTPKGRSISDQGITPDIIVEMPKDVEDSADPQRTRGLDELAPAI